MLDYFNSVLTDWLWLQTNMKNIDGLKLHSKKLEKKNSYTHTHLNSYTNTLI